MARITELPVYTANTIDDRSEIYIAEYADSTVTISIANPGVISWAGHGLPIGNALTFSTTGALPTGITAGTIYYVISAGYTTNSFQVSNVLAGDPIVTTGSQSGTHTGISHISKQISGLKFKSILGNVSNAVTFTPGTAAVANVITHGLETTDFVVELWDISSGQKIEFTDLRNRSTTTVDIYFDENPAGNVRAVFLGKGGVQADIRPYYTLSGLITQAGTANPTILILENTFNLDPVTTRDSIGKYFITLTGKLTSGQTGVLFNPFGRTENIEAARSSNDTVTVYTYTSGSLTDAMLTDHFFEIRVKK